MVHVISYLNLPAEFRSLPSQNSVNVCGIVHGASIVSPQTGRRNVLLQDTFLVRQRRVNEGYKRAFVPLVIYKCRMYLKYFHVR